MVPLSFGCGSAVFAAIATLAPSRAARSAIASPMPRLPPDTNNVLPLRRVIKRTPVWFSSSFYSLPLWGGSAFSRVATFFLRSRVQHPAARFRQRERRDEEYAVSQ